ncbi:hypothetical protein Tco_0467238, partial [Tanacetum coccineum]
MLNSNIRDGLTFGTPTPSKVVYEDNADQDPSSGAHFEHESLVTPKPILACTTRLRRFRDQNSVTKELNFDDFENLDSGDSEFLAPSKKLLNVTDMVSEGTADQDTLPS